MQHNKPNVVVVLVDALRPDHLSCYGYGRPTGSRLNEFAEQSVLFTSAFSASSCTVSSIPSIITGLYPSLHRTGVDGNLTTLSADVPTIAEVLNRSGYCTVGFNTNPLVCGKHGYSRGYSCYYDLFPEKTNIKIPATIEYSWQGVTKRENVEFTQPYVCSGDLTKQVGAWLDANERQPFFMWLHYMDTHAPYLPRQPHFSRFSADKPKAEVVRFVRQLNSIYDVLHRDQDRISPLDRQLIMDCYDSEIAYFDSMFGRLLDCFQKHGLLENTLLIVTADHGEEFWEHQRWGHYVRMFDINLRVPLILRYPQLHSSNKILSQQVRNIDIFPTILEILNLNSDCRMSGVSLLPCIRDEYMAAPLPVVAEGGGVIQLLTKTNTDRMYALRTPEWKYIKNTTHPQLQLYDLQNDPQETSDLSAEPFADATMKALDRRLTDLLSSGGERKNSMPQQEMDSKIIAQLAQLGYA